ncbi:MAG: IPT/TIG domain-containing protein [Verrucomicrobiota bacterium]
MNLKFLSFVLGVLLFPLLAFAAPTITSFSPNFGAANDPTFITITGTGFSPGAVVVKFNGVSSSPAAGATTATEIQAHVANGTPRGTAYVDLTVAGVRAATNNGVVFTVIGNTDPYITGFSPPIGTPGSTSVTITGVHFAAGMSVKFNGTAASGFSVTDPNEVTVTVPTGATSGRISVGIVGAATNISATDFYVAPVVTSFSPSNGRAGTNVVIRGTSFTGTTAVKFGSLTSTFNVDSNTQITATVPANVVNGAITVMAPAGNIITSSNFLVVPNVTGFSPAFGAAGASITVNGASFTGATAVKFGGVSASFSSVTASSLTAVVPAGATNGPVSVTVGTVTGTSAQTFYVTPIVSSFTPTNSAPGTSVKISGSNFSDASAVNFNGVAASSFVVTNNNTIGAIIPNGFVTGPISVTTPGGTGASSGLFYVPPTISGFNPTHGAPGNSVTISGSSFLGATAVKFNGTNASFTVNNNTTITATVPNNATTGPLTVIAPAGTNTSVALFTLDYTNDVSVFVTNAPNPVFVTSNLVYTITVANWTGPFQAFNVMLTNTLPPSVLLKSAITTQGTLNTNAFPVITGALGNIPVGNSAIVTLTVAPQVPGAIANTASAGSDNADLALANNSSSVSTLVWPLPVLGIQNLTNNQLKVFWPAGLSNFTLLFKTNLVPINALWSTDLTARVISGTNISVISTNLGTPKFFRLKQ